MCKHCTVNICNIATLITAIFFLVAGGIVGAFQLERAYRYPSLYPKLVEDADILILTVTEIASLAVLGVVTMLIVATCRNKTLGNMVRCNFFGILCVTALSSLIALALYSRAYAMEVGRLKSRMKNQLNGFDSSWDQLQHDLKCCGLTSYEDWSRVERLVPPSCCLDTPRCTKDEFFQIGCYEPFSEMINLFSFLIIGFMSAALLFQIACITNIMHAIVVDLNSRRVPR